MQCETDQRGNNLVKVYPKPVGYDPCRAYQVKVRVSDRWLNVPVYSAEVIRSGGEPQTTFFASLDLAGAASIRVTPQAPFSSCRIRPTDDGVEPAVSGRSVTFSVSPGHQLSVEFDGDIFGNLQLFVNPIEQSTPAEGDSNVLYFGPGVHTAQNSPHIFLIDNTPTVSLQSGQTLYLAGGAVLKAQIQAVGVEQAVIRGRGILDLLDYNSRYGGNEEAKAQNGGAYPAGIVLERSAGVRVEGIVVKDACSYAVMGNGIRETVIDNLKIFSKSDWSDGIDCVASQKITIQNCYLRSNDDGIAIYATRWGFRGDARDWTVKNCVFLMDCAHAINIGTHGSQDPAARDEICNLAFYGLDILDVYESNPYYWGAIAFNIGDENDCHDVSFERIRMDALTRSMPFLISVKQDAGFNPNPGYRLERISFKDVTLSGTRYEKSKIYGFSTDRFVSGVTFENLTIGGQKVTDKNCNTYFELGSFAVDIRFR